MNKVESENLKRKLQRYYDSLTIDRVLSEFIFKSDIIEVSEFLLENYGIVFNYDSTIRKDSISNINLKTGKGLEETDIVIRGTELIPSDYLKGKNLCGHCKECKDTCLAFSGHAKLLKLSNDTLNNVLNKRVRRTFLFKEFTKLYYFLLANELKYFKKSLEKKEKTLVVRLNVFSDIDHSTFIDSLPEISFYDYTKYWNRTPKENYHLTYSSFSQITKTEVLSKLNSGSPVAIVFEGTLPESFENFKVLNGDLSDLRIFDKGIVIGLKVKRTIGVSFNEFTSDSNRF